jgi:ribosomal-protein-alanine N-acetyltransferase
MAPESVETDRLVLRRPRLADAQAIFNRYACDQEVTRYLGWPRHSSVAETSAFLAFSDAEWEKWPAGPYLIELRGSGRLVGGTGLGFETSHRASTGYVLAKDAWGKGYATEALQAVVGVARGVGVRRLYALCHTAHRPSSRVLEKCGFLCEGTLRQYAEFPNLSPGESSDVLCYSLIFDRGLA